MMKKHNWKFIKLANVYMKVQNIVYKTGKNYKLFVFLGVNVFV